ncbi:MAG TPA: aldehyde dehydrogenase (NADP(+)) [Acidimicrobiales bacterium]|nr:aldehyde dehydrogenase (NADP(+)) [Acidimicrobiales bacterium]
MTAPTLPDTTTEELDQAIGAAAGAAEAWGGLAPAERAAKLRAVADALDAADDDLVPLAVSESHLGEARLSGELRRTTFQLRLFASVLEEGSYLGAAIDSPDPDWPPGPRADLRRMLVPLGPVVVFGASNFPFAFSVAGGDTASALAAGCPVIHKGHPGHPRLAERTAAVVESALDTPGVFSLVLGDEAGRQAILDPRVTAGAFTGSLRGGRALFDLAASRPVPIPFYGELGSLNPVFVTRSAATARGGSIISGYAGSFTLGAGQFCTKPGLLFWPADALDEGEVAEAVAGTSAAPLLNDKIARGYASTFDELSSHPSVRVLASGGSGSGTDDGTAPAPTLLATTAADLLAHHEELLVECFGPTSILVTYEDESELVAAAEAFEGQLTATVQGSDDDEVAPRLLGVLRDRAGRVLWNGWPTGVAVTWAMEHGGPYPATTAPRTTSVGTTAIERFLRPVSYQSVPDHLLPPALQDANPLGIPRRIDGKLVLP